MEREEDIEVEAGWPVGCQQCIFDTEMHQQRVHFPRKCVKHGTLKQCRRRFEGRPAWGGGWRGSKIRTFRQKVRRQCAPLGRNMTSN